MPVPGHSDQRTPAKHAFLNKQLGRFVGALPFAVKKVCRAPLQRAVLVDLTAGDGVAYHDEGTWDRACSPGIFARHGLHRLTTRTDIFLYERAPATYDMLLANLSENLPLLGYRRFDDTGWGADNQRVILRAMKADGRYSNFGNADWGDWVFINNDPNKVHDWALSPTQLADAVAAGANVLSFSTLGCNAGGIKRMKFEDGRDAWYGHLYGSLSSLGPTQDAVLFAIDGDDAQWAYLAVTPAKWAVRDLIAASKVFGTFNMAVTTAQYCTEREAFEMLVDRLFLTAKERCE